MAESWLAMVSKTVDLMQEFWPDYPVTAESLARPTKAFAVAFLKKFLSEINEKTAQVLGDAHVSNAEDMPDSYTIIQLIRKVNRVTQRMGYKVMPNDIYAPKPQRFLRLMKIILHFLIFTNNYVERTVEIARDVIDMSTNQKNLKEVAKKTKEEIQHVSEAIGQSKTTIEMLLEEKNTLLDQHERMLAKKKSKDSYFQEKMTLLQHLHDKYDQLKCQLDDKEESVRELKETVITVDELEHLRNSEAILQQKLHDLKDVDLDMVDVIGVENDEIRNLEQCVNKLETLSFVELSEAAEAVTMARNKQVVLSDEKEALADSLNRVKLAAASDKCKFEETVRGLKDTLSEEIENHENITNENARLKLKWDACAKDKRCKQMKLENLAANYGKVEKDIVTLEKAHVDLKQTFLESYKQLLAQDSQAVNEFNTFCQRVSNSDRSLIDKD